MVIPKQPIFLVQRLPCKKRTKRTILQKITPQMSKELKVVMKKQKTTGQKKDIAQDTANTGKYRPAG